MGGGTVDELRVDMSGGTLSPGTNEILATDGTSLRQLLPPSGDGLTNADAEGGGGGVGSFNAPQATVNNSPTTQAYDDAATIMAGGDVTITANTATNDSGNAQNGSGGLIAASFVESDINVTTNTYAFVGAQPTSPFTITGDSSSTQIDATGASINAGGNVKIGSTTYYNTHNTADSSSGGLGDFSGATADTTVNDNTASVVGASAAITGLTVAVDSSSSGDQFAHAHDFAIAFIGGSDAEDHYHLTSFDTALIDGQSTNTTSIDGIDGVDIRAYHINETSNASNSSTCICIGPSAGGDSGFGHLNNTAAGHQGATVTASPRLTFGPGGTENDPSLMPLFTNGDKNLALYVEAQDEKNVFDTGTAPNIFWNSDVVIYDGPSPFLEIGTNGSVSKAINITIGCETAPSTGCVANPAPGTAMDPGNTGTGIVADIVNNDVGDITMDTNSNGNGNISGGATVGGHHWGTFTFRQNYQNVTIINNSSLTLKVDDINPINTAGQPNVNLNASSISFNRGSTSPPGPGFAIVQNVFPTLVTITGTTSANIVLNGTINNPIGETDITNSGGNILASTLRGVAVSGTDPHTSLIITNNLQITATTGSIGSSSEPYVNVDMITYDKSLLELKATAGTDINLDMLTWLRDPSITTPTVSSPYNIQVDHLVAGQSINLRLQATLLGVGTKALPGVEVNVNGTPDPGDPYFNYYTPDIGSPGNYDPGVFGLTPSAVPSTYNFSLLDAGSADQNGSVNVYAANDNPTATRINISTPDVDVHNLGNVNADTNGFINLTEPGNDMRIGLIRSSDDNVTLDAFGSLLDAPVGSPNPPPIGVQPPRTSPNVVGVTVTLTAEHGSIGTDSNFLQVLTSVDRFGVLNAQAPGVIRIAQTSGDTVTLWDPVTQTFSRVVNDSPQDLHVGTVTTCFGSSATTCADVSLTNYDGAITDGHNNGLGGTAPNVIGDTINLLALAGTLAGNIGDPSGLNDLKVNSSNGSGCTTSFTPAYQDANYQNASNVERTVTATCDFAAQADNNIYVTETQGPLNVLLAHASDGNVRLTTTETGTDGNAVAGASQGEVATLSAPLSTSTAVTSIGVSPLATALTAGSTITILSGINSQTFVVSGAVGAAATSIPVFATVPNYAYSTGAAVLFGAPTAGNDIFVLHNGVTLVNERARRRPEPPTSRRFRTDWSKPTVAT